MTLADHLDAMGVIPKPAPTPEPPAVDRTRRGWVPKDRNDECPY